MHRFMSSRSTQNYIDSLITPSQRLSLMLLLALLLLLRIVSSRHANDARVQWMASPSTLPSLPPSLLSLFPSASPRILCFSVISRAVRLCSWYRVASWWYNDSTRRRTRRVTGNRRQCKHHAVLLVDQWTADSMSSVNVHYNANNTFHVVCSLDHRHCCYWTH